MICDVTIRKHEGKLESTPPFGGRLKRSPRFWEVRCFGLRPGQKKCGCKVRITHLIWHPTKARVSKVLSAALKPVWRHKTVNNKNGRPALAWILSFVPPTINTRAGFEPTDVRKFICRLLIIFHLPHPVQQRGLSWIEALSRQLWVRSRSNTIISNYI